MQELNEVEWEWLKPHLQRDALILVDLTLSLQTVGTEIAKNNTNLVQLWIQTGQIKKPSQTQISTWEQTPALRFRSLIIAPYVLIQLAQSELPN